MHLPEDDAAELSELLHMAGLSDTGLNEGSADHDVISTQNGGQLVAVGYPVLQRQDHGVGPHQRRHGGYRLGVVVHLDRVQDEVDRPDGAGRIGSARPDHELAGQVAGDAQPTAPDGIEVGASGDECDILAGAGQQATEVAADPTGAHNGYSHWRRSLFWAGLKPAVRGGYARPGPGRLGKGRQLRLPTPATTGGCRHI